MGYKLIIAPKAKSHIEKAIVWYKDINVQLTVDFINSLDAAIEVILSNPLLFQKVSKKYRKINLSRFPYKVVYTIDEDKLIVAAVIHHKRSNKHWISRK